VNKQLALNLRLHESASFDNFCAGSNHEPVARLRGLLTDPPAVVSGPPMLFLWGEAASGKTHLLQSACRQAQSRGQVALYLPLGESDVRPELLEEAEHAFLVCLDDVHRVARDRDWEASLFALYERGRSTGVRLVASANGTPTHIGLTMPDLATRLAWGPIYQLAPLRDEDKPDALRRRALGQGLELGPDVARYILNRYPRDLHSLFRLIDRIDRAALVSQRRITIPFIQEIEQSRDLG
jgi:DnaA-homolog protein